MLRFLASLVLGLFTTSLASIAAWTLTIIGRSLHHHDLACTDTVSIELMHTPILDRC
jgi:hypothetical protein